MERRYSGAELERRYSGAELERRYSGAQLERRFGAPLEWSGSGVGVERSSKKNLGAEREWSGVQNNSAPHH